MADRTVSVKLKADISDYTSSLVKAAAATRALGTDIDREIDRNVSPQLRKTGERSGGVLAQGVRSGLVRNSPLIAAAVGGALAAGAPVALAGAAILFGGIAGVAGSQSLEVRKAWTSLGEEIARGTVEDAAVIIPELTGMADDLGESFERLRPQLRAAFEATAPLVQTVTDGVTGMAENAMPGLVRAVERGAPVMDGFRSFLESTGTGLTRFFDAMSEHAPAAGAAFAAIGDIVEELLPIIGQLLGQGAELASIVLPPLANVLGVLADVVEQLGPALPILAAGFAGLNVAKSAAGWVGGLSSSLSGVSAAAGPIGAVVGFSTAAIIAWTEAGKRATDVSVALGRAMQVGGAFADGAAQYHERFAVANDLLDTSLGRAIGSVEFMGTSLADIIPDAQQSNAEFEKMYYTLPFLERAALDVAIAEDAVTAAVSRFGENSPQAIAAVGEYERAQEELERQEGRVETAINGVTTAMIEQADQALAAIDSSFAYRNAQDQLEDAQIALNEAIKENGPNSEVARRAQLALEEQAYRVALSFGQQRADLSGLDKDSAEYARLIQTSMLQELYRLRDAAGPQMAGAIQTQINALERSGVKMDENAKKTAGARDEVNRLDGAVKTLTPGKTVKVEAPTSRPRADIDALQSKIDGMRGKEVTVSIRTTADLAKWAAQNGIQTVGGYAEGGYTGPGRKYDVAGLVHAGEYVFTQEQVRRLGVDKLEGIANGAPVPGYADGGIVVTLDNRALISGISGAIGSTMRNNAGSAGTAGRGAVPGTYQSMFNLIQTAFPLARLNSGFRPGDPGYHGRGKAVDLGQIGRSGGLGHSYLAAMNQWIHDRYGASSAELIYDGIGDNRPDLKNGRPLTYSSSTQAQHRNHVHWATYDQGGVLKPGLTVAYNGTGRNEYVSKEIGGGGAVASSGPVQVQARIFIGTREITDIVRVEAATVVAQHDRAATIQGRSNR